MMWLNHAPQPIPIRNRDRGCNRRAWSVLRNSSAIEDGWPPSLRLGR